MIHIDAEISDFEQKVDDWVAEAIRSRPYSFSALVNALPGVYPLTVLKSLTRLASRGSVSKEIAWPLLHDAGREVRKTPGGFQDRLPVPHPLDFDWRFTPSATQTLSRFAQSLGKRIACVGTPSVFANLNETRCNASCEFYDCSNASVDYFRSIGLVNANLLDCFRDAPPAGSFEAIVMDPPWYEDDYKAFMWMASQLVDINGFVVVIFPPLGTRPNVELERRRVIGWGSQLGMHLVQLWEGCLPYVTPHFEVNSLRSAGILCELGMWRRGTLAVFRMHQRRRTPRPACNGRCEWDEVMYLGTRFRFKRKLTFNSVDVRLESIVEGDVLGSVSRRDPTRRAVDVWTSGNRVFRCQGPTRLYELFKCFLRSSGSFKVALGMGNRDGDLEAVRQLASLASLEKLERESDSLSRLLIS